MTVARLVGLAVDKLHHARHGIVALEVGVVEALDYIGHLFQLQSLLKAVQHPLLMPFGVDEGALFLQVDLVLHGVAAREVEQFELVATLRNGHLNCINVVV